MASLIWTSFIKDIYAICMALKKLVIHLEDAYITICSDHFPVKWLLNKNMLNAKVNNLAVKLTTY